MASLWVQTYNAIKAKVELKNGKGGGPAAGAKPGEPYTLPKTKSTDLFAILAELHPEVMRAISKWGNDVWIGRATGPEGKVLDIFDRIGYEEFLLARASSGNALVRMVAHGTQDGAVWGAAIDKWYVFMHDPGWGEANEENSVKFILEKWDRCIELTGGAFLAQTNGDIRATGATATNPSLLSPAATTTWWKSLYALCLAIEVVIAIPQPGLLDRIGDGIKYAATETAHWVGQETKELATVAGEAAGQVATVAGEATGKALAGFWRTSGFAGYLFVGAAIFLVVRGYI